MLRDKADSIPASLKDDVLSAAEILLKYERYIEKERMGKVISYEEAAVIIGNHFPEIKDKLLNLLQLQQLQQTVDDSLLVSAIEQKTAQLKPLPFHQAFRKEYPSQWPQ